jgi:protoheme IX farnesyltransferase
MFHPSARALLAVTLLQLSSVVAAAAPDAVYINARIWTGDDKQSRSEAMAVAAGKIVALGSTAEIRPLATGKLQPWQVLVFAVVLGALSMTILIVWVNALTAALTFASLIGYAVVYTVYLKRATPQNIVIGGAAGAAPPVLGWTAVTGTVDPHALLLFLIIFTWTPPHFWALAIARRSDYERADIPMLPVTHGVELTKSFVVYYTVQLILVPVLPYLTGLTGMVYLVGAQQLGGGFFYYALKLKFAPREDSPRATFRYSIWYLMALFSFLLIDHYMPAVWPA